MRSKTINSENDSTVATRLSQQRSNRLRQLVWEQWIAKGEPDLVSALRAHPDLRYEQSLLMELATDEYESRREDNANFSLTRHCERFEEFGRSICLAIHRQLDVQTFLDNNVSFVDWPAIGDEIGGFHILELLGKGASARVYLCNERDAGDRLVVLKVSPFTSFEASILGRLNHPNITPLYSTGCLDDAILNYVCMPFLGRSTLADVIDIAFENGSAPGSGVIDRAATRWHSNNKPPRQSSWKLSIRLKTYVDEILDLSVQIAAALEEAHKNLIVHGDLKPSNILLSPTGKPILLDFNLSRDFEKQRQVHGGTLAYMPPESLRLLRDGIEQADSHGTTFCAATDIFSFGALLHELFTGLPPVSNIDPKDPTRIAADKALKILKQRAGSIRQSSGRLSGRISALIDKCLSYKASDRFQNIHDVRVLLESERTRSKKLLRYVRSRPISSSVAVGTSIALSVSALLYAASQPAAYLRDYQAGMALLNDNHPQEASDYLIASVQANSQFIPARYALAKARAALGEWQLAMGDFAKLSNRESHAESTAYLAYCYNLNYSAAAAIPLYERAIKQGLSTLAVRNNLAASYMDGSSYLSISERLEQAELNLELAHKLDPSTKAVKINYLRLANMRSRLRSDYSPYVVWEHAYELLDSAHNDEAVKFLIQSWWELCSEKIPKPQSAKEAAAQRSFEQITRAASDITTPEPSSSAKALTRASCYIEPL